MERPIRASILALALVAIAACGGGSSVAPSGDTTSPAPGESVGEGASPAGTSWVLGAISGTEIPNGVAITLAFAGDSTYSGFAGCNNFNGTATIDGSNIEFGVIASTKTACPDLQFETSYLAGLDATDEWEIEPGDILVLRGGAQMEYRPF